MKITETVQVIIPEHIGKNNITFNKPYQELLDVEQKQVNKISTANMGQFSECFSLGPFRAQGGFLRGASSEIWVKVRWYWSGHF